MAIVQTRSAYIVITRQQEKYIARGKDVSQLLRTKNSLIHQTNN